MKKIVILAISAILAVNMSAQEQKKEGKALSKEERIEMDIQRLTNELYLSDKQAEKFASTYREYAGKMNELFEKNKPENFEKGKVLSEEELDKMAKKRFANLKEMANLQEKFYDKFRKDLNARQVEKVMRPVPACEGFRPGCPKQHFEGSKPEGFKPGCGKPEGQRPDSCRHEHKRH